MNYPIQSLVYIAPILFLLMMVAFPVIGVFGGWKRAAYWGGGNFLFYIIGMIIWTFAGTSISQPIIGFIKNIIGKDVDADFSKIAASVLAPIFFVSFLLIANIILVINYYAWFKRVAGLSKYKTIKKKGKNGTVTIKKIKVQHNYSTQYKVMSMVVGGVGMGALMLPTTFATTNALFFTTTSYKTRAKSKFSSAIYNATVATDVTIDWLSYYTNPTDSAVDYDALFAALDMTNDTIEFVTPEGESEPETLIEALEDTFDYGIGGIHGNTLGYEDDETQIIESVNYMIDSWNALMDKAGTAMFVLFNSNNATAVVAQIVINMASSQTGDEDLIITPDNIHNYIGDPEAGEEAIFYTLLERYNQDTDHETFHKIQQVDVSQRSYDNIVDAVANLYQWNPPELKEQHYQEFRACMYQLMGLMFY